MKRLAFLAAVASLCAFPAWGQTLKMPAPKKSEAKAETKSEPKLPTKNIKPVYRKLTAKSRLDARECLKHKTDEKVIVCAEKFL